jgi:hypothetical protein
MCSTKRIIILYSLILNEKIIIKKLVVNFNYIYDVINQHSIILINFDIKLKCVLSTCMLKVSISLYILCLTFYLVSLQRSHFAVSM